LNTATLIIFSLLILYTNPVFAAETCAHVSVRGTECVNLSVDADLKACGDDLVRMGRVRCANGVGSVIAYGKKSKYRIEVSQKNQGAWGESEWVSSGVSQMGAKRNPAEASGQSEHSESRMAEEPIGKSPLIAPPVPEVEKPTKGIELGAYFDGYLGYNFNNPRSPSSTVGNLPDAQNNLRAYDIYSKQFRVSLAEISLKAFRKQTRLIVDLDFGDSAEVNAQSGLSTAGATPPASGGPSPIVPDSISKHIGQAVLSYSPNSRWLIEAGKMPTHIGYELMKAKDNWNYSRSFLYAYGIPIWHTGFHVNYDWMPERFSSGFYLYQGWNTIFKTTDSFSYGAQLKWTPNESTAVFYNYIGGPNTVGDNADWRQLHELIFSWLSNQKLSFAVDFIYGNQKKVLGTAPNLTNAEWGAVNLGMKWQMSPEAYLAPRLELYRDVEGWTLGGGGHSLYSATFTGSKKIGDDIEARLEYRYDLSTHSDRFITQSGVSGHQSTLILGMLFNY